MLIDKEYVKTKNSMQKVLKDNPDDFLGFLQKFYAANVVREIFGRDEKLKAEAVPVLREYLKELYASDYSKKLVSVSDDNKSFVVTTMALLETIFPEFLDGSFSLDTLSEEQRELVNILFTNSRAYQSSTVEFQSDFQKIIFEPLEIKRDGYQKVHIAPELKELLYEDYGYCRNGLEK